MNFNVDASATADKESVFVLPRGARTCPGGIASLAIYCRLRRTRVVRRTACVVFVVSARADDRRPLELSVCTSWVAT